MGRFQLKSVSKMLHLNHPVQLSSRMLTAINVLFAGHHQKWMVDLQLPTTPLICVKKVVMMLNGEKSVHLTLELTSRSSDSKLDIVTASKYALKTNLVSLL